MEDNNLTFKEKKIDTDEFTRAACTLPKEYKKMIYYMIKGIELSNELEKDKKESA